MHRSHGINWVIKRTFSMLMTLASSEIMAAKCWEPAAALRTRHELCQTLLVLLRWTAAFICQKNLVTVILAVHFLLEMQYNFLQCRLLCVAFKMQILPYKLVSASWPLAECLMHMAPLTGNTSADLKSSSDWLNSTGFLNMSCSLMVRLETKPSRLIEEESCRVYIIRLALSIHQDLLNT